MEAVPRIPMLEAKTKHSPDSSDFLLKLKRLIKANFQEDPETFVKELETIGNLRTKSCIVPSADIDGLKILKKYYCQLHFIQSRFKIKGDSEDGPFAFPWVEIYSGVTFTYCQLDYELAAVLYNIGAIHTQLANKQDRTDSEGLKLACTHFQCATWAFQAVRDKYKTDSSTDLSSDLLQFLSMICLAQAQECILEKSILDHRKPAIIAKVCAQVHTYYDNAWNKLLQNSAAGLTDLREDTIISILGWEMARYWASYAEFKCMYYNAMTNFYQGLTYEDNSKMGEAVAYFGQSSKDLVEAGKVAKQFKDTSEVDGCLGFTTDVIDGKYENAKKENEYIYHEKVPDFQSLPKPQGASLVKGIGFDITDPEISGPDVFNRLVPLEAHEAASLYSEEKARLLREVGEMIEDKDAELAVYLSSMNMDEIPNPGDHIALPQEVIECAASLSAKDNAVGKLTDAMKRIAAVSADVQSSLDEIKDLLDNEDEQQQEYEAIVGKRPTPISADLEREYQKYREAHTMASDSNATLHKAMQLHLGNLKMLSMPIAELQALIPSMADIDEESEASITQVQSMLKKIEEMRQQREELCEEFRQEILKDDITKELVKYKDQDMSNMFEEELKKHEPKRKIIMQNLYAQSNILAAMTDVNAGYSETRRIVSDLLKARKEMIGSLVASFYAFDDLLVKAAKGLEFYAKLDTNVSKLLNRVKGVVAVQQEERDAILAKTMTSIEPVPQFKPYVPPQIFSAAPFVPPLSEANESPRGTPPPTAMASAPPISSVPLLPTSAVPLAPTIPAPISSSAASSGKMTLKDYLDAMKETNASAKDVYAVMNDKKPVVEKESNKEDEGIEIEPQAPASMSPAPGAPSPKPDSIGQALSIAAPVSNQQIPHFPQPQMNPYQYMARPPFPPHPMYGYQQFPYQHGYQPPVAAQPLERPGTPPKQTEPSQDDEKQQSAFTKPIENIHVPPQTQTEARSSPQVSAPQQDIEKMPATLPMQPQTAPQPPVSQPSASESVPMPPHSYQAPYAQPQMTFASQMPYQAYRYPYVTQPQRPQWFPQQVRPQQQPQCYQSPQMMQNVQAPPEQQKQALQYPQAPQPIMAPQPVSVHQPPSTTTSAQLSQAHQPMPSPGLQQPRPVHPPQVSQMQPIVQNPAAASSPRPQISQAMQYPTNIQTPVPTAMVQPQVCPQAPQRPQQMAYPYHQQMQMYQQNIQNQYRMYYQSPQGPLQHHPYNQGQRQAPTTTAPVATTTVHCPQPLVQQPVYGSGTGYPQATQYPYKATPQSQPMPQSSPARLGYQSPQLSYTSMSVRPSTIPLQYPQTNQSSIRMQPIVPQPGSSQSYVPPYQTSQVSPAPSPFKPIRPDSIELERRSSLDDILTDVENSSIISEQVSETPTLDVLKPKVMTPGEIQEQKIEAKAKEDIAQATARDPYDNQNVVDSLYEQMASLEQKINDKIGLDTMWRELNVQVENDVRKTISIARCYPMKNRSADVLPFDNTRVELPTTKDDYINASHIRNLPAHSPKFIATQAPTSKTINDFWTMVWQESVETMICLLHELDYIYWPADRKEPIKVEPDLEITLQSVRSEQSFTERIFTLMNKTSHTSRVVIHLQLNAMQPCEIVGNYLQLASTCLGYHRQQRVMSHPVLVHCLAGSGKTAVFLLIAAAMAEMEIGQMPDLIPNMTNLGAQICQQRKGILKEKEHFKQALQGVIKHAKALLVKKGKIPPEQQAKKSQVASGQSDIGDLTSISSQLGFQMSKPEATTMSTETPKMTKQAPEKSGIFSPDLSKLADLSLNPASPNRKKITKQDFMSKSGGLNTKQEPNSEDPLSQLDPLWSLK